MGLMKGSVSVCRFRLAPFEPDFARAAFEEIPPGSEIRRAVGFVPMARDEQFDIGRAQWAGRLRVDEIKPDPVSVADRYEELCEEEMDSTGCWIGKRRRRELKELAVEEMSVGVMPKRRYVEWVIDGGILYVGSTSKGDVGEVLGLMRRCGAGSPEPIVPWAEMPRMESSILEFNAWGPRFLRNLFEAESGRGFELEEGRVAMVGNCKISLLGDIAADVVHHLEQGAEIVVAKLNSTATFILDAERWWIKGATLLTDVSDHWAEHILLRVEAIAALFDALDAAFAKYKEAVSKAVEGDGRAWIQTDLGQQIAEFMGPSAEVSADGRTITVRADEPPN